MQEYRGKSHDLGGTYTKIHSIQNYTLARIMRLDRCNCSFTILLSLFLIVMSTAGTYLSMVVTGWAMPNSSCVLKYSIKAYYIISIKMKRRIGIKTKKRFSNEKNDIIR